MKSCDRKGRLSQGNRRVRTTLMLKKSADFSAANTNVTS